MAHPSPRDGEPEPGRRRSPPDCLLAPLAEKSRAWAMDLRRYLRQEQSQGQISPTDAALLTRLCEFLDTQVAPALDRAATARE